MYQTDRNLILSLFSCFVMKTRSKDINSTLQERLFADVLQNCWCSQKSRCYLKLRKFHLKKTCAGYRVNVKFRLYAFCLHLNSKDAPTHSCFSVSSAEVFRWPFFLNTVGWVLLTLYTIYLNQTNAWQLVFYLLFLQTLQKFLGTNWKKYDSRRDLLHVSKCLASRKCHLTTKNKFTPDIYNLWYCGAPKTFKRFPRKLSW